MEGTPEVSDERLFARYAEGDLGAFETLFARYQGPLQRHLERMLGDPAAAEDLVIETFLRLHRHRGRLRPGAAVRGWIYTIARNLARNRLRRERLRSWLPLTAVDSTTSGVPPAGWAPADDDVQRRVAAAFAALPARQRETCSLRLLGELSLEEIARVTGASVGTVKSRLFYGQRRLRELLADLEPGAG
jgi:RNA polymerase sigma-70 factor (ECF subfamily)